MNAAFLVALTFGLVSLAAQSPSPPQSTRVTRLAISAQDNLPELRAWDDRINNLVRANGVTLRAIRADTILEGRVHERYDQYVAGVRVFGGDVARQVRAGVTESIFGSMYEGVDVDTVPTLSEPDARLAFASLAGPTPASDRALELVVLPRDDGRYALAWRSHVWRDHGWWNTFIDAHSGETLLEYNDLQSQAAVGTGTGVLGDQKKISTNTAGGQYVADDKLRPPILVTYDMRGNRFRTDAYLDGRYTPTPADLASDSDNIWTDSANVDAHAHLGWTYDFYFKRFGRRGLDDREAPIHAITHPVLRSDLSSLPDTAISTYMLNAFWCGGCGPNGLGVMVFGEGLPSGYSVAGQYWDYLAGGLDVVAHELTHGLTEYSSNLTYLNESGALNESFSDMLGTSAEFFYQASGAHAQPADYLIAEDVIRPGGLRSMAAPRAFGDPDHYSRRFQGSADNGGVHTNSGIPNNAFYLAIEGGVNQTSGLRVQGVGAANREQIEKVFYRAFVSLLPSNATFRVARAATIQSARDLYGIGSAAERAVTEAWTAVGVN